MSILYHVKKHGKTITLHLKKHHKKYIFGILSATLLWKGIGLITTYAVVHNLSFSFADLIHGGDGETATEIVTEVTTTEETLTGQNELDIYEENIQDTEEIQIDDEGTSLENTSIITNTADDEINISHDTIQVENNQIDNKGITNEEMKENDDINNNNDEENLVNNSTSDNEEDNTITEGLGNGICDNGDINILTPASGNKVGKTFDISREFTNEDCKENTYTIRLRNFNDKYLDIFTGDYNITGFSFDSTQLLGDGTNQSGTNYFSGHKIAIVSNEAEIIYWNQEGGEFTIDNKAPEISDIKIEFSTQNEKLNIGDTITISFESDEEIKKPTVNILGQYALLEENNGNNYKYSMDFSEKNTLGKVVYGIEFEDMIGNTGYIEGYEDRELDYTKPTISNLGFSKIGEGKIKITFNTNKKTDANLIYQLSGTDITNTIDSTQSDLHRITLNDIGKNYKYNYSISIKDDAKNTIYIGGNFYLSGDNVVFTGKEINQTDSLINFGFKGNTENLKVFTNTFDTCAENINTKDLKLVINKHKTTIVKIPEFSSSSVNTLTNAFIAILFERIENEKVSQEAIDEITEDLNNFLIVVKLVKDDGNECKQNMSEYYINKFKNTLKRYGIIK